MKPIKQRELLRAISVALGQEDPGDLNQEVRTEVLSQLRPLRILLAEDSLVNQKLAIGLLKRSKHRVVAVTTGAEAVAAVQENTFDLVLMDVQMPEMDGLEATRQIREAEIKRGTRIPIVAMTAHAMKGDRERCLQSGMDAYISKPVRERELVATLASVMNLDASEDGTRTPPLLIQDVIDWPAALHAVAGDGELLRQVVTAFLIELPNLFRSLNQAIRNGHVADASRAAHTARSALRHFGLYDYCEMTQRIEESALNSDWTTASVLSQTLEQLLRPVCAEMRQRIAASDRSDPTD